MPVPVTAILSITVEYIATPGSGPTYQVAAVCANTASISDNVSSHIAGYPSSAAPYTKTTFTVDLMTLAAPAQWFYPGWSLLFDIVEQTGSVETAEFRVYGAHVDATYADGSTQTFTPGSAAIVGKVGLGTELTGTPPTVDASNYVNDPGNAIDGNLLTYAAIHRDRLGGAATTDYPNLLLGAFLGGVRVFPALPGPSLLRYPFTQTIGFRTVVGRFQNGREQRAIAQPGGLVSFEIAYDQLTLAQKDALRAAFTAAGGQFSTTVTLTLGATTYTDLSYDSDQFAANEAKPTIYHAPLKLSQTVTQSLSPTTPGLAFPLLGSGAMSILPYTQKKTFQTVASKLDTGPKWTTPEFGGGYANYPTDGLFGWDLDERMLNDADRDTRIAHFIANWGRAYSFPFTDEDGTTYSNTHYASDQMVIRYNDVNNSDIKIGLEVTY